MATTRQSIIRGPGTITYNSLKLFDKDGISAEIESSTESVNSSFGSLDTIKTDQIGRVTLTPIGNLSEDLIALFYPSWLQTPEPGRSIFGSSDTPLTICSKAGTKVVFNSACITRFPEMRLSPVETAFGQVEFSALLANGKLASESNSFYSVGTQTYADGEAPRSGLTGFHYEGPFGSLSIPDTLNGWTIGVDATLEPVTTDSQGTIDYTLGSVQVTARCTPLGLSESQILAALPALQGRGNSIASANDLVITASGGLTVTLKCASLVTGPLNWGATSLRAGEIGFTANIDPTDGSLFEVSYTDPE